MGNRFFTENDFIKLKSSFYNLYKDEVFTEKNFAHNGVSISISMKSNKT